ncbi:MAG: winged helix-turn-helix transcriptional regulator [Candidatus Omnitrophica bacterium]|nr:winged helix-turn-helix transcriptional regulator [Candidatus Omnitrophota bacterium]
MTLKRLRQVLKGCADDTRLRILNILRDEQLTVKDICKVLSVSQTSISKHLSKLRLLKIVADRRAGNLVYYSLDTLSDTFQNKIVIFIILQFPDVKIFKKDKETLRKMRSK